MGLAETLLLAVIHPYQLWGLHCSCGTLLMEEPAQRQQQQQLAEAQSKEETGTMKAEGAGIRIRLGLLGSLPGQKEASIFPGHVLPPEKLFSHSREKLIRETSCGY